MYFANVLFRVENNLLIFLGVDSHQWFDDFDDKTYLSYHSTDKNEVFNKAIKFRILQVIVEKHSRLPLTINSIGTLPLAIFVCCSIWCHETWLIRQNVNPFS